MMTTCPASSQSLPVPGVIACVLKHKASLSPQTLTCFPLCSPNACGRHVFGIGDREPHAERCSCCCRQGLCPAVPPHLTQVEPGQIDPQRGPVPGQEGGSPRNLHPGCQRVREDGGPLLSHCCCLLTGYHRSPSPLHLPLPAPALAFV